MLTIDSGKKIVYMPKHTNVDYIDSTADIDVFVSIEQNKTLYGFLQKMGVSKPDLYLSQTTIDKVPREEGLIIYARKRFSSHFGQKGDKHVPNTMSICNIY
jgi:hypothetical protein